MSTPQPPSSGNAGSQPARGRRISSQSYTPEGRAYRTSSPVPGHPSNGAPRAGAVPVSGRQAPAPVPASDGPHRTHPGPPVPPLAAPSQEAQEDLGTPDTSSKSVGKSSLVMASGTAVSRVLGLVRNLLLVAALGATGSVADAFDIANKIPNILFAIIAGGALNAVIVPQVMKAYKSPNSKEILDKLLTLTASLLFGLTLLLTVGATVLVGFYTTNDWSQAQTGLAVAFAFWCIPQLFFYGLYTLLGQVLNARGQFGPYMWAPAVNNVISIIGFGAFLLIYGPVATGNVDDLSTWDGPKIAFIGVAATLGVVAQALVLFIPLYRSGFRWNLRFGIRGIGLRSAGKVGAWTILAILLDQIGTWVFTRVATAAPLSASPGVETIAGNASYTQALMIYLLPHSLVTVSVATALFTGMSAAAAKGDTKTVSDLTSRGLRVIAVFTIFATALLMVLSRPVTKLLIPSLTPDAVNVVAPIVWSMSLGLMPLGAMVLMKWVYFAFEDGRTVFFFQIPVTIVLIGGTFLVTKILPGEWWVFGIGLSMSLANLVCVLLRINGMRQRLSELDVPRITRLHVQLIVAAAISGLAGWGVLSVWGFEGTDSIVWAFVVCVIVGLLMLAVYVLALQVMKVQEFNALLEPFAKKLNRRKG